MWFEVEWGGLGGSQAVWPLAVYATSNLVLRIGLLHLAIERIVYCKCIPSTSRTNNCNHAVWILPESIWNVQILQINTRLFFSNIWFLLTFRCELLQYKGHFAFEVQTILSSNSQSATLIVDYRLHDLLPLFTLYVRHNRWFSRKHYVLCHLWTWFIMICLTSYDKVSVHRRSMS